MTKSTARQGNSNSSQRVSGARTSQYQSRTIGDLERQTGTKFKTRSDTKVTKYLSDKGVPSLGRVFKRAERKLAQ